MHGGGEGPLAPQRQRCLSRCEEDINTASATSLQRRTYTVMVPPGEQRAQGGGGRGTAHATTQTHPGNARAINTASSATAATERSLRQGTTSMRGRQCAARAATPTPPRSTQSAGPPGGRDGSASGRVPGGGAAPCQKQCRMRRWRHWGGVAADLHPQAAEDQPGHATTDASTPAGWTQMSGRRSSAVDKGGRRPCMILVDRSNGPLRERADVVRQKG